jgi:hypothetical protein
MLSDGKRPVGVLRRRGELAAEDPPASPAGDDAIIGRPDANGLCDPETWKKGYAAGCDAHGTPPDFRPHPSLASQVAIVREAYHQMP